MFQTPETEENVGVEINETKRWYHNGREEKKKRKGKKEEKGKITT